MEQGFKSSFEKKIYMKRISSDVTWYWKWIKVFACIGSFVMVPFGIYMKALVMVPACLFVGVWAGWAWWSVVRHATHVFVDNENIHTMKDGQPIVIPFSDIISVKKHWALNPFILTFIGR